MGVRYWQRVATAGIPAVIEEVKPSGATGGSGTVYYIREPNGALIARVEGSTIQYYHFDSLGSTRLLTNSTGTVTDTYSYDAWGFTTHDSGSTSQPYQYVGQLGYYTHYQDGNMNLLQLGVRFYAPTLDRFTQVDPVDSVLSAYMYCRDNGLSYVDPSGRFFILPAYKCYDCVLRAEYPIDYQIGLWNRPDRGFGLILPRDNGWNEANAVRHCVRACNAMRICSSECAGVGGTACYLNVIYEGPALLSPLQIQLLRRRNTTRESLMDIWNNSAGMDCAKSGQSCAACCLKKYQNDELRHID